MKKKTAQVVEVPVIKPLPKQRHLVTPLSTVWLSKRSPNAASPYTVDASESYTQYVYSSYSSGTTLAFTPQKKKKNKKKASINFRYIYSRFTLKTEK